MGSENQMVMVGLEKEMHTCRLTKTSNIFKQLHQNRAKSLQHLVFPKPSRVQVQVKRAKDPGALELCWCMP